MIIKLPTSGFPVGLLDDELKLPADRCGLNPDGDESLTALTVAIGEDHHADTARIAFEFQLPEGWICIRLPKNHDRLIPERANASMSSDEAERVYIEYRKNLHGAIRLECLDKLKGGRMSFYDLRDNPELAPFLDEPEFQQLLTQWFKDGENTTTRKKRATDPIQPKQMAMIEYLFHIEKKTISEIVEIIQKEYPQLMTNGLKEALSGGKSTPEEVIKGNLHRYRKGMSLRNI